MNPLHTLARTHERSKAKFNFLSTGLHFVTNDGRIGSFSALKNKTIKTNPSPLPKPGANYILLFQTYASAWYAHVKVKCYLVQQSAQSICVASS